MESAIEMDMRSRAELTEQMQRLTCLENPNSVQQMKKWLAEHDVLTESLGKKQVVALLKDCPEDLREVLILRQQLAKSSVKKYIAMRSAACADGRVRGAFQFYGANRSGRWAGRNVQLQNLPQNHMEELAKARACPALRLRYHSKTVWLRARRAVRADPHRLHPQRRQKAHRQRLQRGGSPRDRMAGR